MTVPRRVRLSTFGARNRGQRSNVGPAKIETIDQRQCTYVLTIVQPATFVRWHRAGFCGYWRWKSRERGGRPQIEADLLALIRQKSIENSLWGAPRIHGEFLKLRFDVAHSSVAKYMVKRRGLQVRDGTPFCAKAPTRYGPVPCGRPRRAGHPRNVQSA